MTQLTLDITDSGEGPVFDRFFAGYDRAFVLPDEKEDRDGLVECLALNHGEAYRALERRYGRFRELCLIARDETGAVVGGANLIALRLELPGAEPVVSANLNYLYVEPEARGRGHLRRLVETISATIAEMAESPARPLIFIEQNDPFAMSAEAYARDSEFTGLDQLDRLRIWARMGARIVDIDYIQPPLSPGQQPDDGLVYAVLGASGESLPACVVAAHLRMFFGISVLKGAPLDADPTASRLLGALDAACHSGGSISLIDPSSLLSALTSRDSASDLLDSTPSSLRGALSLWSAASSPNAA
nr:GNAT family N-acetyltransferase [Sphingomonas sp.]